MTRGQGRRGSRRRAGTNARPPTEPATGDFAGEPGGEPLEPLEPPEPARAAAEPGRTERSRAEARRRHRQSSTESAAGTEPEPGRPARRAEAERVQPAEPAWAELADRWFVAIGLAIVVIAAILRLVDLAATPMHNDEGVNGWFVTRLVRDGVWAYDPANYHGPTLFYLGLASEVLFGLTTEAMRLVPAAFGIATVVLLLALRPFIGSIAALSAAALVAVSPGAVYISRYFIHEMLLAFFTLAIVVGLLWYLRDGRERYLIATAAAAAAHFATKETGIISLAVLAIALAVGEAYVRFRSDKPPGPPAPGRRRGRNERDWRAVLARRFSPERLITAALVFAAVYVPLFTSFGQNTEGLGDSVATFAVWTQTGAETQVQPFLRYLEWIWRPEIHILVLGTIGGLISAIRGHGRLMVFIGLWALGITLAYSLISYKTPWIAVNMLIPLAILGGMAVRELGAAVRTPRLRWFGAIGLAALLTAGTLQAVDLSFNHDADETYGYVTVHTTHDMYGLIDEAERYAGRADPNGRNGIVFYLPEYWPLPWYFRDNPKAGFFGQIVDTEEAVVVANVNQEAEAAPRLTGYVRGSVYTLRPGVDAVVYVRADLAGSS